ncbi:MAG: DUF5411 family protein [Erysipelotrichaceae bacterium]
MSSSVKIYGLIVLFGILLLFVYDLQKSDIAQESLFNGVRTTQLSVIEDAILWGEVFVNDTLMIDEEWVKEHYPVYLHENVLQNVEYEIKSLEVLSEPASILVCVDYQIVSSQDEVIEYDYTNMVILDRRDVDE